MLTARGPIGDKVALLDLGADDYRTKPFALDELRTPLSVIQSCLDAHRSPPHQEFPVLLGSAACERPGLQSGCSA